jgi:hypothetical protein
MIDTLRIYNDYTMIFREAVSPVAALGHSRTINATSPITVHLSTIA